MNIKSFFLAVSVLGILTVFGCDDDEPTTAKISGTITIQNIALWPVWADSGEVQVTVFPEFSLDPLAGWGDVPDDFFFPGSIGGRYPVGAPYNSQDPFVLDYVSGQTTYAYELEVEPGTYSALACGFYKNDVSDANRRTAPIGVHWDNPTQVSYGVVIKVDVGGGVIVPVVTGAAPQQLTLVAGDELQVDFSADFSLVNSWYHL
jgi:hypothetical protein